MRKIFISCAVFVSVSLSLALFSVPVKAAPPTDFQTETFIVGLNEPTAIEFLPDGRMLVLERYGDVHVVQAGASQVDPLPVITVNADTFMGERGLTGITLDPNFASNGYFYLFYTHTDNAQPNPGVFDRVSRFTLTGNSAGSELLLWEDNVAAPWWHHGGSVILGPDNKLFISIGDGSNRTNEVQSLASNRGKILRINLDGTVPTDNPFWTGSNPVQDRVYALGFRNPFRLFFDQPTNRVYIGDVGGNDANNSHEEINILNAGGNYGWPICEGPERNPSGGNCTPPTTPGTYQSPFYSYPHVNRDASVTGGLVYRGGNFPSDYQGDYFYGDYVQNWIRGLDLNPSTGSLNGTFNFEPANGTSDGPYGEIVDFAQGPDGAIYYVDIGISWEGGVNPGTVRRIRYTAANQPPVITTASATPTSGVAPLVVNFTASATDAEGGALSYSWDFGDGQNATEQNPTHTYTSNGSYSARLTVSDGSNSTLSQVLTITVGAAPVIDTFNVISPSDLPGGNITFRAGDQISFSATASDPDGTLSESSYDWRVVMLHLSHTHPEAGPINASSGSFAIPTQGHEINDEIHFQFILTVTDAEGLTASQASEIFAETVDLTFASEPSGLTINVNGLNYVTPATINSVVNFDHTVVASSPQTLTGNSYEFVSWSDGGAASHMVNTPHNNQTYTAVFEQASTTQPNFALSFDGADLATGPQLAGSTGTQTIEVWVKPAVSNASGVIMAHANDNNGWSLELNNGLPSFWVDSNGPWDVVRGTTPLQANTWYHIAVTYSANLGTVFVNGVEQGQKNIGVIRLGPALTVGGLPGYPYFNGTLDEVRISSSIRYTQNFSVPTSAFGTDANTIALYHLDENSGTSALDSSGANRHLNWNTGSAAPAWIASDSPLTPANGAPNAQNDLAETDEDMPVTITVLSNDTDPENDPLSLIGVTQGTDGSISITGNSVTYTPNANSNGTDSFTYTVSDGQSSDTASVTVTVNAVNDLPVAVDDSASLEENTSAQIAVLANDTDVDNDTLTVVETSLAAHGLVVINPNGTISYTPETDYIGSDTFSYTIDDGRQGTDSAVVNVTVTEVNDAPVAVDDNATVAEDNAITLDILANDSDPNSDPLDVTSVSTPNAGTAQINANDTVTYTPPANYSGVVSFNYTISDGRGGSATADVELTITAVNDAPVASSAAYTMNANTAQAISLQAVDVEGSMLSYTIVSAPQNGSITGTAPSLSYTPNTGYSGNDNFTFRVNDGELDSNLATVSLTINPVVSGASLTFDGANDIARFANIPLNTTFTYEAWVKRTADTGGYETFLSDASSNYGQAMFALFIDGSSADCGSGDQFAYYQKQGGSTQCSGVNAELNRWYHVAVSRASNGTRRFFVDGVLVSTQNSTPAPTNSNGLLTMGRAGDYNGEYFAGSLDEVRISNVVRYTAAFTPSTFFAADANTVALYHLNEGSGQTISNAASSSYNGLLGTSSAVQTTDPTWSAGH